jgi:3-oxoacyl-[acyl-carrier protein] reductase
MARSKSVPEGRAKVALVTGAARGLGRAIAERLAADGFGIVINDVSERVTSTATDLGAMAQQCDLTDAAAVRMMFAEVRRQIGPVSVLVNNAGMNADASLTDMTDEQWRRVIDLNLTATFTCTREAAADMLASQYGRIVNLSSIGILGNRNTSNYAASKAGIVGLTRSAALEFASKGVTVNAVAPGVMDTEMYRSLPDRIREILDRKIPVKRIGVPADVAAAVSFLVSTDAAYITGQTLFVDGGISLGYL